MRHLPSGIARLYFIVSASFAFAALQNVTVDDAMLTGTVVPQYLPSNTNWAAGNTCSGCFVKPDSSLAYNGTWHDTTYSPNNTFTQAIEFTFTGNALYIYFIIANTVPYATTFTSVEFVLDQVSVSTYTHSPSTSTSYQYNVPVYTNSSLPLSQHNMKIQPINTGNNSLILFDYLIYTVDTSTTSLPSTPTTTTSATTSSLSPISSGTSSVPNFAAIVGGAVGGAVTFMLMAASLVCYWRYKRRNTGRRSPEEGAVVDPFIPSPDMATAPSTTVLSVTEPISRTKMGLASVTTQSSGPPASVTVFSSAVSSSNNNTALLEQVELLRDEVARLRELQDSNRNIALFPIDSEPPPEYS